LLAVYALGIGIPFIAAGLAIGPFLNFMRRFRKHLGTMEKAMGVMLIITGILFVTGGFNSLGYWLLETFPTLGQVG
jgi:cytochrome c-type biogenesis protein